jgi:hypothetical protein
VLKAWKKRKLQRTAAKYVMWAFADCFELYHMKLNYGGNDNYFAASIEF